MKTALCFLPWKCSPQRTTQGNDPNAVFGFSLSKDKVDNDPLTWYFIKNLCYFCIAGTVQIVSFEKGLKFSRLPFKVHNIR